MGDIHEEKRVLEREHLSSNHDRDGKEFSPQDGQPPNGVKTPQLSRSKKVQSLLVEDTDHMDRPKEDTCHENSLDREETQVRMNSEGDESRKSDSDNEDEDILFDAYHSPTKDAKLENGSHITDRTAAMHSRTASNAAALGSEEDKDSTHTQAKQETAAISTARETIEGNLSAATEEVVLECPEGMETGLSVESEGERSVSMISQWYAVFILVCLYAVDALCLTEKEAERWTS